MQNETHEVNYYGMQHDTPVDQGTTHLSMVDKWGGAVAITSTVNPLISVPSILYSPKD